MPTADVTPVGGTLPDGTTITVTFNPTAEQEYTATITHAGAGLTSPVVITINGEGIAPAGPPEPAITITPTPPAVINSNVYDFGTVRTTDTNPSFTYILTGSDLTAENLNIQLAGTNTANFSLSQTGNITPTSGTLPSTTITVTFNPTAQQSYEATITHSGAGLTTNLIITLTGAGVIPTITLTATQPPNTDLSNNTYDFGNLAIDQSPTELIYNITGENLSTNNLTTVLGTDAPAGTFTITGNTTSTPQNGALPSTTITIAFNPNAAESYTATITHSGAGLPTPPIQITLTGIGIAPEDPYITLQAQAPHQINASTLDFAALATDDPPKTIQYNITGFNLTNAPLTLALEGTGIATFSISTTSINPINEALPDPTTITVTFNPTAEQEYNATITHAGAGLTEDRVLTITGTGVATGKTPTITLKRGTPAQDITELTFGDLQTDATPTTQEYTITGENLTNNVTLTLTGKGNAAFTITSPTNTTLTPTNGALSQVIIITFNPTAVKEYTATINHTGGGSSPIQISLTGTGIAAAVPALTLSPTELTFGNLATNATPATQNYTITGTNLKQNVTLTLTGDGSKAFTITSPTNTTLTPTDGALSQAVTITFNPTAEQEYTATIAHNSIDLTEPTQISLTGTGTAPTTTPDPGVLGLESIESIESIGTARLSPNPVTDRLYVQGNGTLQVQVRNILGATLLVTEITNSGNINFSTLPAGLYLVSVQSITGTETATQTQRILKR